MTREVTELGKSANVMTSLEIAQVTGKQHKDVMKAIRNMEPAWEKICGRNFALSSRTVTQPNGGTREVPCYSLNKTECLFIATKFNDIARAKLVIRWEELEKNAHATMTALPNFEDPAEAAIAWAKEYREKKQLAVKNVELEHDNLLLAAENQELKHDKNYLDLIMRSKALLTISQIAQDYGMSGKALNKKLFEMGIQYSVNGQWVLYAEYKNCGYVSSKSFEIDRNGVPDVVMHTEWTQAGRKFLYEKLKAEGILPMLEREK